MNIQEIWKEVKSFEKQVKLEDFRNLMTTLGYRELAYKVTTNKKGVIIKRKFLVLTPSNRIEIIVLGKTLNILSITSKQTVR